MLTVLSQVALGGAIGSVLRFGVSLAATRIFGPGFPYGTLAVNLIGSFAMGVLAVTLAAHLRPLLMTGLLGGFTTFSAFTFDTMALWEAKEPGLAALYLLGSVVLGLAALMAGAFAGRGLA